MIGAQDAGDFRPPPPMHARDIPRRLAEVARRRRQSAGRVLARYVFERLLYRVGRSAWIDRIESRVPELRLGWRASSPGEGDGLAVLQRAARQICRSRVDVDDAVVFDPAAVTVRRRVADDGRPTVDLHLHANVGDLAQRLAIRVDEIAADVPPLAVSSYPTLLDLPPPRVRVRAFEAVVAEMVLDIVLPPGGEVLLPDFLAVWRASRELELSGQALVAGLRQQFEARHAAVPRPAPIRFLVDEPATRSRWRRLAASTLPPLDAPALPLALREVEAFVLPPLDAMAAAPPFRRVWRPGRRWQRN
jgi:hypothetical protein